MISVVDSDVSGTEHVPECWIHLFGGLVGGFPLLKYRQVFAVMALLWGNKPNAAVLIFKVVPRHRERPYRIFGTISMFFLGVHIR
jgi:hypothetical protein